MLLALLLLSLLLLAWGGTMLLKGVKVCEGEGGRESEAALRGGEREAEGLARLFEGGESERLDVLAGEKAAAMARSLHDVAARRLVLMAWFARAWSWAVISNAHGRSNGSLLAAAAVSVRCLAFMGCCQPPASSQAATWRGRMPQRCWKSACQRGE